MRETIYNGQVFDRNYDSAMANYATEVKRDVPILTAKIIEQNPLG